MIFSLIVNNNRYVYVFRSKTQAYSVSYKASLNIRVIALPISFTFKDSLDLDAMNNDDNAQKKTDDTTKGKEKKVCAVNASCWVTTFEDECCLQRGNVSLVRYVEVRDEALAFKLQSEVVCVRACVCLCLCLCLCLCACA